MTEVIDRADLLPGNASAIERTASRTIGPWTPGIPLLKQLASPKQIPANILTTLAAAEDIPPIWPPDEQSRRALIAASPKLHAHIGTPKGLKALARLAGAEIVRLEMPPAKTFLGYWDQASRQAWLSAHPEMRLYTLRTRAPAEGLMLGASYTRDIADMPTRTAAMARSAIRGEIVWPDGRVEPLTTHGWSTLDTEATGTVDLARPASAVGMVIGQPLAGQIARADASTRYWRIEKMAYRERINLLTLRQMAPSMAPLTPDAEPVAERAVRSQASCLGAPITHTARSDANTRIYTRIRLNDPDIAAKPKYGPTYLGFTRLTSPPFIALAYTKLAPRSLPFAMASSAINATLAAGDARARIAPVLDAMNWARATHDKILIKTRLHGTASATRIHKAGSMLAGQTLSIS